MGPADRPHVTREEYPPALRPGLPLYFDQEPRTTGDAPRDTERQEGLKACSALLPTLYSAAQRLHMKGSAFRVRAKLTPSSPQL